MDSIVGYNYTNLREQETSHKRSQGVKGRKGYREKKQE